jgi:hypothetical protein
MRAALLIAVSAVAVHLAPLSGLGWNALLFFGTLTLADSLLTRSIK